MKQLILLGISAGAIPVIAEIADEVFNCKSFLILKNIEVNEMNYDFKFQEYEYEILKDHEYHYNDLENNSIHFGVLSSHIKFILYHHFNSNHSINADHFVNLIHPDGYLSKSAVYKKGFALEPKGVVSSLCKFGFGVTVKRSSSIGHHVELGDFVSVNPGVVLSGFVKVGTGTEIGTGTTVVNNINIGKGCLIGAGSVVTKDIPNGVVAYGNPCKVIRTNERWEQALATLGALSVEDLD